MSPLAQAYARNCLALSDAALAGFAVKRDIAYGAHLLQRLDVIAPADARDLPVMLFLHGGGFSHGCKEWGGFMAPALGRAVLVLADYRLVPEASAADMVDDAHAAYAWTRAHIAPHGGDPARIFVGGHSAGGALAAFVALLAKNAAAGALCLSTSFNRLAIAGTPGGDPTLPSGPMPVDDNAPLALPFATAPPFLIIWGGQEAQRERVERSSMAMIERLRASGAVVDWGFDDEADHFATHLAFGRPDHPWSGRARRWMAID